MIRVVVAGAFDPLHPGHLALFRAAKQLGDELVIIVGSDAGIARAKGRPPVFRLDQRVRAVEQAGIATTVVAGSSHGDFLAKLDDCAPSIFAAGYDQRLPKGIENICRVVRMPAFRPQEWKSSFFRGGAEQDQDSSRD